MKAGSYILRAVSALALIVVGPCANAISIGTAEGTFLGFEVISVSGPIPEFLVSNANTTGPIASIEEGTGVVTGSATQGASGINASITATADTPGGEAKGLAGGQRTFDFIYPQIITAGPPSVFELDLGVLLSASQDPDALHDRLGMRILVEVS